MQRVNFIYFWRIIKKVQIILYLGCCAIIVLGIQGCSQPEGTLKFTIGNTVSSHWTPSSGKWVDFTFEFNNVAYKGTNFYHDKCTIPGGRYFVAFYPEHIHFAEILQNAPVPDSIKTAPPNGWQLTDILIGRTKAEVKDMLGDNGNLNLSDQWLYVLPTIYKDGQGEITIYFENGKAIKYKIRPV